MILLNVGFISHDGDVIEDIGVPVGCPILVAAKELVAPQTLLGRAFGRILARQVGGGHPDRLAIHPIFSTLDILITGAERAGGITRQIVCVVGHP